VGICGVRRFREILPLRDYIVSSPVVSDGKVVVGTMAYSYYAPDPVILGWPDEMHVICLDEATGKEEWYVETILGVYSSPSVVNRNVFAASREMMCINLKNGKILWNSGHKYPFDIEKPVKERYSFRRSTPVLYHGIAIGGSSTLQWSFTEQHYIQWQKIVFIDHYTGDILWEWAEEGVLASSPAFYQGKIYIYSYDGMVRCISLLEGEKLWETSISEPREMEFYGFRLWSSPTAADNKVYIGSIEGVFLLFGC
jgi:outer membrane protein assembly factor BamB